MRVPLRHFNSIKVRLEPNERAHVVVLISFQFHKGAIRTGLEYEDEDSGVISIP